MSPPTFDDPAILVDAIETIVKTALGPVVDRLKALETTTAGLLAAAPVVGPEGPQGPPGDTGMGFDEYGIDYDGERTFTHRWARGELRHESAFTVPMMIYRGVWTAGKLYSRGDAVTHGGSVWHANQATTIRPGDGPAWQLAVKHGRDAR